MKKKGKKSDTLLKTTFVTSSFGGRNVFTDFFWDFFRKIKGLFRLRSNMKAAKTRLNELESRQAQLEAFMDSNSEDPNTGHKIDKNR